MIAVSLERRTCHARRTDHGRVQGRIRRLRRTVTLDDAGVRGEARTRFVSEKVCKGTGRGAIEWCRLLMIYLDTCPG